MSNNLNGEVTELISTIAKSEGYHNFETESSSGSIKGDGFMGVITMVTIREKGSEKQLDLILKSASIGESLRKQIPIDELYLREIEIYEHVLPELLSYQKQKCILRSFNGYAKFYGSCKVKPNECLVLENLKTSGFELWNKKLPMNSDHISLVFTEYAKLHSISFALKELEPNKYEQLTKNMEDVHVNILLRDDNLEKYIKFLFKDAFVAVQDNQKAKNALEKLYNNTDTFFVEDLQNRKDHLVISHGDSWCNNMMFQYQKSQKELKKPTKICFLDWQLAKVSSPVLDLAYFFLSCSSKEILKDFKKYLRLYHQVLSENLKDFGCDPEQVFSYNSLEGHWKKYSKFGFYMSLMVIKLMTSDSDETPDMENLAASGFQFDSKNMDDYNKRITYVLEFLVENDLV